MSSAGLVALRLREGQVPGGGYYNDNATNCTYGTGLLAHLGPCTPEELRRTVDTNQAQAEFQRRTDEAARRVREQVQDRSLTQNQFDALVSATFNTRRVLPHPGMFPSRDPIASPECSRSTTAASSANTL